MRSPLLAVIAVLLTLLIAKSLFADTKVQLRILETTDIHTHIVDYDYFQDRQSATVGLVRTATLVEAARAEVSNSVLVDNGDLLQGNPLGDYIARERGLGAEDVHPVYKAMNLLDYDVANIGNHEFNFGVDFLEQSIAGANFPYISANVFHADDNDQPYFDQYLIIDHVLTAEDGSKHDIKIGYIGFVPPQIMKWDMSNLKGTGSSPGTSSTRPSTSCRRMKVRRRRHRHRNSAFRASRLPSREGMDENASYYHLSNVPGHRRNHCSATATGSFPANRLPACRGVDIDKGTINGVPATMPGFWGSHLGLVDLQLTGFRHRRVDNRRRYRRRQCPRRFTRRNDGDEVVALVEPIGRRCSRRCNEEHDGHHRFRAHRRWRAHRTY